MYSLNGMVNDNVIRTNENLRAYEGRRVIITILDETVDFLNHSIQNTSDLKRRTAVRDLAGMWRDHKDQDDVDDMVRNLRRGRQFDI